jgi:hypothetical protein
MIDLGNNLVELRQRCPSPDFLKIVETSFAKHNEDFEVYYDEEYGSNFQVDLGGGIYLIETPEDLIKVETLRLHETLDRYYNITEAITAFDICEYIENNTFVYVLLCTNNGGGNTYLIPRIIADIFPTIDATIAYNNCEYVEVEEYLNVDNS